MTTTVNDYINQVIGRMLSATPRREQIEMELRGQIAEKQRAFELVSKTRVVRA